MSKKTSKSKARLEAELEDRELRALIAISDATMELQFEQWTATMEHGLALRDLEEQRIRQSHVQPPEPAPEPTVPPRGPDGRFVGQGAVQQQPGEDLAQSIKAMDLDQWSRIRGQYIKSDKGLYQ